MNQFECPNCGAQLDKNESCCKYCGSPNPNYVKPAVSSFRPSTTSTTTSIPTPSSSQKRSGGVNIVVAIILILFCWPIGLIYIIAKSR